MGEPERAAWKRIPGESTKAFDAFREYLALPARHRAIQRVVETRGKMVRSWSYRWSWQARAASWDDEVARVEDAERLEALRAMSTNHARAARAVQAYALSALARLDVDDASPADVARLLDLGARLERVTLTESVEELQGRPRLADADDPWTRIAVELMESMP